MPQKKEIETYMLAGLFAGFMIVFANGVIFFGLGTGGFYNVMAGPLNPFALMYGSMLPPVIAGLLLYYLAALRGGVWLYVSGMTILSVWAVSIVLTNQFADYAPFSKDVKHILLIMVIVSCAGNIALPLIAGRKRIMAKLV